MEMDYGSVTEGLQQLKHTSPYSKFFGSQSHGSEVNPTIDERVLSDFEAQYRVVLPADYRGFLLQVGNGGAGPSYGLFPLGIEDGGTDAGPQPWQEDDGFVGIVSQPFPHDMAWNDLSGRPEFDEEHGDDPEWVDQYQRDLDAWEKTYWCTSQVNGAIPICHLGCALRQWLVITGPEAGNVWNDDRAEAGGLKPLQQNGRPRTTFLQWYCDWLDKSLKVLE